MVILKQRGILPGKKVALEKIPHGWEGPYVVKKITTRGCVQLKGRRGNFCPYGIKLYFPGEYTRGIGSTLKDELEKRGLRKGSTVYYRQDFSKSLWGPSKIGKVLKHGMVLLADRGQKEFMPTDLEPCQ